MSTNLGGKFYICATPQASNLNQAAFEALTWVEVKGVGSRPETGTDTNIVTYPTFDEDVTQKGKGVSNAGDGTLELKRLHNDPGQIVLRAAAATKRHYATKYVAPDAPSDDYTGTTFYNRGLVVGPKNPGGRAEDFVLETFTFGNVQTQITVNPSATVAPVNSLLPSIAGIAQVGQTLTALPGTWSGDPTFAYQWKNAGVNISGATNATYIPVVGDIGDAITVTVTATTAGGSTSATSGAAANVIAA